MNLTLVNEKDTLTSQIHDLKQEYQQEIQSYQDQIASLSNEIESLKNFKKNLLEIYLKGYFDKKNASVSYFQQIWKIISLESKDRDIQHKKFNLNPERIYKALYTAQRCTKDDKERLLMPFICKIDGNKFSSMKDLKRHNNQDHKSRTKKSDNLELSQYQIDEEKKNRNIIEAIKQGQYYKQTISHFEISYGKYQNLKVIYSSYLNKEISEAEFSQKLIPQKPIGRKKIKLFYLDKSNKIIFIDIGFGKAIIQFLEHGGDLEVTKVWMEYRRIKQLEAFENGFTSKKNEIQKHLIKIAKKTSFFHASRQIFFDEFQRYNKYLQFNKNN